MTTAAVSTFATVQECAAWPASVSRSRLIDVRSPAEYASGHIPGSVNIPMNEVESRVLDMDSQRPPVLVCQSGKRARICASLLSSRGMDVLILSGGLNEWRKAGLAVVVATRTRWSLERQVRLGAGLLLLLSVALAELAGSGWLLLTALAATGLTFAGITDICLLGNVLSRMPWNQPRPCRSR